MECNVVKYLGYQYGTFTPRGENRERPFCSCFIVEPMPYFKDSANTFVGERATKEKVIDPRVFTDTAARPGDYVELHYNRNGYVDRIDKVADGNPVMP